MRINELIYITLRDCFSYFYSVITHSLCVLVCGLNAMRVSGDQGESHVGERGT